MMMVRILLSLLALSLLRCAYADVAQDIEQMTGARTKLVWLRATDWAKVSMDGGKGFAVMGIDTADKAGERQLAPVGENYNPLISPDGKQVIFSAGENGKQITKVVGWDGGEPRTLIEGYALWVWADPTGAAWVIYDTPKVSSKQIKACRLDNPAESRPVYSGDDSNRLSLSADGSRAIGEFPWPNAGMLYLNTRQIDRKNYRTGCNSYIAPDNSYRVTVMAGSHDIVTLYEPDGRSWDVRIIPPAMKPLSVGGNGCVWNPKWSTDARHMVVAGPFRNLGPDRGDIWLGQFSPDFKSIARWVQVSNTDAMDVYAFAWMDPGLGQYQGEAPYSVQIPPTVLPAGTWTWNYGDGTTDRTPGKHTYLKAGDYTMTATQGAQVLKGRVRVTPREAPRLTGVRIIDETHLLAVFSEPVQEKTAKITFTSGKTVKGMTRDSEGSGILIETNEPLADKETVVIEGVQDLAQVPNTAAKVEGPVVKRSWPTDCRGLAYVWENARVRNMVLDPGVNLPVTTTLNVGGGRTNRFGVVMVNGQMHPSPGSEDRVMTLIRRTHQFSMEMVIRPENLTQGMKNEPLNIVSWAYGWRNGIFWLFQDKEKLQVALSKTWGDGNPNVFDVATLPDAQTHHLIISCAPKRLVCYLDGKKVSEVDPSPAFVFELSPPLRFVTNGWRGQLEGMAMYGRFIDEAEAAKNAAAYAAIIGARKLPPQIEVQAKLLEKSLVPKTNAIAPYRNALVVGEYEVEQVVKGRCATKRIRIARWAITDLRETPFAAEPIGTSTRFVLENFTDHPELVPELISDTLPDNDDLTLYVPAE